jgi:hypothetical protein
VRARPGSMVLATLALLLLLGGCGGPSPETRARQTRTAHRPTRTPTSLQAARTAVAQGTFTGIDQASAAILTAEALLPVAPPPIVVGTVAASTGEMTELQLTEELIAAAMDKVDAQICTNQDRCYAFSDGLVEARNTCTPTGHCRVGWVVDVGKAKSWSVWIEVGTGQATLVSGGNP